MGFKSPGGKDSSHSRAESRGRLGVVDGWMDGCMEVGRYREERMKRSRVKKGGGRGCRWGSGRRGGVKSKDKLC